MQPGEKKILLSVSEDRVTPSASHYYNKMFNLYSEEWGFFWLKKELEEADTEVRDRLKHSGGSICWALQLLFERTDNPRSLAKVWFIGTKRVTGAEFALYAKGLYFMAGYQILNSRK